jgi:hypothetical protein
MSQSKGHAGSKLGRITGLRAAIGNLARSDMTRACIMRDWRAARAAARPVRHGTAVA